LRGLDFDGVHKDIPNALTHLSKNLDAWNYDSSGLGPGLIVIGETRTILTQEIRKDTGDEVLKQICVGEGRVRHVQFISLAVFRQLLVNHFSIYLDKINLVANEAKKEKERIE
jgi:hypothetical protein